MLWLLARKEWVAVWRDRRLLSMVGVVIVMLTSAIFLRASDMRTTDEERARAKAAFRAAWLAQGTRNAHEAAHYGTVVSRPLTAVSAFEAGMERYMGTTVTLVAHQQSDAAFPPAGESGASQRFGELQPGMVITLLLPLVIIFLAHESVATERRGGTTALLLTQNVSPIGLLLGKTIGLSSIVLSACVVALVAALPAWWPLVGTLGNSDVALRLVLLAAVWGAYLVGWIAATVVLSARVQERPRALLALLLAWAVSSLLVPRIAVTVAAAAHPLPTRLTFNRAVAEEVRRTFNGHDADSVMMAMIEREQLARYGVKSVAELPINLDGILMQRGEENTSRVYNRHFASLNGRVLRQRAVIQWMSVLSPYLATRSISSALAGADYSHHVRFMQQVEQYRLRFVQQLNAYQTNTSKTGDWSAPSKSTLWNEISDFAYEAPSVRWSLGHVQVELLVLGVVFAALTLALLRGRVLTNA